LKFTQKLYQEYNVKVLPGAFLSRRDGSIDPGENFVRIALVEDTDKTKEVLQRVQKVYNG